MDSEKVNLIAVVDDEDSIRRALARLLRSAGLGASAYASGADFINSLSSNRPDCVVLDLHMPDMNGFEVQSLLMEARPPIPVVVITGHDSAETREQALSFHPAAYLLKPIHDQTLIDAIRAALQSNTSAVPE